MEINQNRHSLGGSNYHMQFTPKYRKPMFRNRKIRGLVKASLQYKANMLGVTIEAMEFGPDHVHIFMSNCRKPCSKLPVTIFFVFDVTDNMLSFPAIEGFKQGR